MAPYVLVVDNNPLNREFIDYVLTTQGYAVKTAGSVDEGLRLIDEAPPCLILSDLNLPQRSGFDFLKQVKCTKANKNIPFFLISSTSYMRTDVEMALNLGAVNYLFRPIEPRALLEAIKPYLEGACCAG